MERGSQPTSFQKMAPKAKWRSAAALYKRYNPLSPNNTLGSHIPMIGG